jgi:hypothetical protein
MAIKAQKNNTNPDRKGFATDTARRRFTDCGEPAKTWNGRFSRPATMRGGMRKVTCK